MRLTECCLELEIERLPGCGSKIARLYQQWVSDDKTAETYAAASDAKLSALKLFYNIWGVGDTTARRFYEKGAVQLSSALWTVKCFPAQPGINLP